MSELLPMFPLQIVVYPEETLNLHIFETRYKQLINECNDLGNTFGIPPYINNKIEQIATELEILSIEKRYPNGELDVKLKAIGIFHILEFFPVSANRLYPGAEIEKIENDTDYDLSIAKEIIKKMAILFESLKINKDLDLNADTFSSYQVAHHLGFSIEQEYTLLCISDENTRQHMVLEHLNSILPVVVDMEKIRAKAAMNGSFQHLIPPSL
ncbi:MAG TPA: LON peptidase substrate-binding domain-containing protein [Saprospiraceae bacterium]|nr:LON peptidase substrate-binding domain-containing protein [Saprospiraceae bacterium]